MKCALCLQSSKLRRSHIIPEFLYQTLYDEKHQFKVLSILSDQDNRHEQKGLREPLLCDACEQRFSVWERYARLVLKGGTPLSYRTDGNVVFLSGLDYQLFKLFQLSVLWRAGVSSLQFFEKVQLGKHEEILRKLLLAGDPGSAERYGCLMFGLKLKDATFTEIIMQPGQIRLQGQIAYRFVFGGFMWVMFASSEYLRPPLTLCTLGVNGESVLLVRDGREMDNLASFCVELQRIGRSP